MEGVTDFATRLWFSFASAPTFQSTPFLRVTEHFPFKRVDALYAPELMVLKGWQRYQLIPQVMTGSVDDFCRIAERLLDYTDYVDLNCGCPAPTVVGNGAGSAMLKEADKFHTYVRSLGTKLGPGKLSVKMRLGFHDEREFAALFAGIAQLPLAQLQIHGRTRADRYTGRSRWEPIGSAARAASYPVVASGDINQASDLNDRLRQFPQIKKVMIGRGALRNPWIFAAIREQQPIQLDRATITTALETFALLQNLQLTDPATLLALAERLAIAPVCGTDLDRWLYVLAHVVSSHGVLDTNEVTFHPHTLGRTKMLWNSWRSSLPLAAFAPEVFRSKSLGDFLAAISQVLAAVCGDEKIGLEYRQEWDWLYAGEKRNGAQPAKPTEPVQSI